MCSEVYEKSEILQVAGYHNITMSDLMNYLAT